MKNNFFNKILFLIFSVTLLISCSDREIIQIENVSDPIILDLSSQNLVLDGNFPDNPALTVSWTPATYSVPAEIKYRIEGSATSDFAVPYAFGNVSESQRTVTYNASQVNAAAGALNLPPNVSSELFLRVIAYLGNGDLLATSDVTSISLTPYELQYPTFYLVGAASYVGWNAGTSQVLYKKEHMSYIYTYMTPESFRFLGQQGWDPVNYSIDLAGTRDAYRYFKQVSSNLSQSGDENMSFSGTEGIYKISINAKSDVQSLTVEAASITDFDVPSLYLVGSMNGWSDTGALPFTKTATGVYEITTALPADAEFKFLGQQSFTGNEWGNILKDNNGNSGFLGTKNDNSNVVFAGDGGNYKITVNLKAGTYTIVK